MRYTAIVVFEILGGFRYIAFNGMAEIMVDAN